MSRNTWTEALMVMEADGSTLSSSASATSILNAAAKLTLPANFFDIGKKLRVTAQGRISNIVTSPGTVTFDFRLGGTVVFNGGTIQLSTTAHTNVPFWLEFEMTCRAIGSSGNLMGQGRAMSQAFNISTSDSTSGHSMLLIPNTAPGVGSNVDTTASLHADLFATFSASNAGNAITLHQYELTSPN